jgi:hypothetical protein
MLSFWVGVGLVIALLSQGGGEWAGTSESQLLRQARLHSDLSASLVQIAVWSAGPLDGRAMRMYGRLGPVSRQRDVT